MIEQRTTDWMKLRMGKITASECAVLMKNNRKKEPFSDATYSYLDKKVMERYIPDVGGNMEEYIEGHTITNAAMRYGTELEPMARQRYAERMDYEVMEVEFLPLKGFEMFCGASADGIVRKHIPTGEILNGGVELKCPYTVESHLTHLLLAKPEDLLEAKPEYYWQCVLNMLAWDADWWDFVSFCPYVGKTKQLKVLRIHRDKEIDGQLIQRITLATEYMKQRISEINSIETLII